MTARQHERASRAVPRRGRHQGPGPLSSTCPAAPARFALITLDNGHRPHAAEHLRPGGPGVAGGGARRGRGGRRRRRRRRRDRQAVHLRRRRRPHGMPLRASRPRTQALAIGRLGPRRRSARLGRALDGADVRLHQRRGHGRRPRGRAALHLPDALVGRAGGRACPRCFLGLVPGWGGSYLLPEPHRRRRGGQGHHREPAQHEPDAQRAAGLRARHRRCAVRAR